MTNMGFPEDRVRQAMSETASVEVDVLLNWFKRRPRVPKQSTTVDFISSAPDIAVFHIFPQLSTFQQRRNASLVSKQWNKLSTACFRSF